MKIASTYILATTAALFIAAPAFAATTIKVTENGEAGQPMSLVIDKPTVKAGSATFVVHNDAMSEEHEMVLVKLKSADETIPVDTAKNRIDEKKLKSVGEVSDLKPGKNGTLKAKLTPGTYLLFCNIKGHYAAGMQARLTVTK